MSSKLETFRNDIDADKGLAAKRKVLIAVSVVLLALNLSGAKIDEANTFLFKISFGDHNGIIALLCTSILYLMVRYYGYAQKYHSQLFEFWSQRMLGDWRVFRHDPVHHEIEGLLGKKIDLYTAETPGILNCKYVLYFPFRRKLSYLTEETCGDTGESETLINFVNLGKFNKNWGILDYLKLMKYELAYQFGALIKYREGLDLLAPYVIGLLSLASVAAR